jgi:hypothetical protein
VCIIDLVAHVNSQVILIQEQLSKNRIIVDTDNKGRSARLQSAVYKFILFLASMCFCLASLICDIDLVC